MDLPHLPHNHWSSANIIPVGMGVDLVSLPRIEQLYQKYDHRFLDKILTPQEKHFCLTPVARRMKLARIAGRIAVKEAVVKTLRIGIAQLGNPQGTLWTHVEVLREEHHAPRIKLHHKAAEVAHQLGIETWWVTLTHDGDYAMAMVMGVKALPTEQETIRNCSGA